MKKIIFNHGILMIAGPIIGLIALLLVHLLPTGTMATNVYWSLDMIRSEFEDEVLIDGYRATLTGNFTDCLMLEHAVYAGGNHSVLEQAMRMYRGESHYNEDSPDDWYPGTSLCDYLVGNEQPREVEYARYWHGYLVILKPLLLLTSVQSIRLFAAGLQLILVGVILLMMSKRGYNNLGYAFLASIPFLFFVSTFASLSLSICFYLMILSVALVLWKSDRSTEIPGYCLLFMEMGMMTSYFDFLTYPIVVLGYPLSVYILIRGKNLKTDILHMILLSAEWAVGYLWMWVSKWIFADLFTGAGTIKDAIYTLGVRTDSAEGYNRIAGMIRVVKLNLKPYLNWGTGLLVLGIAIMFLCIRRGSKIKWNGMKLIPHTMVALIPFAWWFVTQNHSEQHWIFTCRIFAVTVFALFTGLIRCLEEEKQETRKETLG